MATFSYYQADEPLPPEIQLVDEGLDAHNFASADFSGIKQHSCFAKDDTGTVIGGSLSRSWGSAYEIQWLWVKKDLRGGGVGKQLLDMIEAHARSIGCASIYLETFSFQAPEFYKSQGFKTDVTYSGFPDGHQKFLMSKVLDEQEG